MARSLPQPISTPADPVHEAISGPALPRTDRNHPRDLSLSEAGERGIGRGEHSAHRTVAVPGSSPSAADRTHHQTERTAGRGEPVPADEKLVSLFEPHADIFINLRSSCHAVARIRSSTRILIQRRFQTSEHCSIKHLLQSYIENKT